MSKVALKICGIREAATLAVLVNPPVEYLGFVFHRPSSRYLEPSKIAALARAAPGNVIKVGVFVDAEDELIAAVAESLDMLQLHGSEPPSRVAELKRRFGLRVIKAIQIKDEAELAVIDEAIDDYGQIADFIMLDAGMGSGKSFDWSLCAKRKMPDKWFLAGGINAYNVAAAVKSGAGVLDVSGGVESVPGKKSEAKIKQLIEVVTNVET